MDSTLKPLPDAKSLTAREVLRAAWPLFQVSLPGCLPLAVLGVAASGVPGAEAVAHGDTHGLVHGADWWGLYLASNVLMLICYSGVLRKQLALARGEGIGALKALQEGLIELPQSIGVLILTMIGILVGGVLLIVPGLLALVYTNFAWIAQIDEKLGPTAAIRRSVELVRGRVLAVAGIIGALAAGVLVFVLLTGILMAIVMNLAGRDAQESHVGLSFSRWLLAGILSLPVVYIGAVTITAWRTARATRFSAISTAPTPPPVLPSNS
ncbi:MAG: hypothetical protein ABI616_11320 [Pseudomonadota bacterium]